MLATGTMTASERRPITAPANRAAAATGEKLWTCGSSRAATQSAIRASASSRSARSERVLGSVRLVMVQGSIAER